MLKKIIRNFAILILIIFMLPSCKVAYRVLFGIDTTPHWNTDKQFSKQQKRHNISTDINLIMDTVTYLAGLKEVFKSEYEKVKATDKDSSKYKLLKNVYKDDTQPTQFRLFDQTGKEVFKLVNCYIDPPIPMNWNVEDCFESFPPEISIKSLNVHNFDLNFLLSHSRLEDQKKISINDLPKADYYCVVVWNTFFKRPSRKLIKTAKKYVADRDKSIVMLYLNNHHQQLWSKMDAENKEKVKNHYYSEKE